MKESIVEIAKRKLSIKLKKLYYEREAVFAAAYKFTNRCSIRIQPLNDDSVEIIFKPLENEEAELNKIADAFLNEVLDQQVRLDLEKRYGNIRDLIVKHAFAPIRDLKEEIDIDG